MRCDYSDISKIFNDFHYKGKKIGGGISVCFVLIISDKISGGAVLGKPRHEGKYPDCIDIRRMACLDEAPKNSESYFIGKIIQWVKCNTEYKYVLSYSDKTVGHQGTIYKASNFVEIGETTPTKYIEWNGETYHPRSLSIDREYSYRLREDIKSGKAVIKTGKPKKIWIYKIPEKGRRKKMYVPHISNCNPLQKQLI